VTLEGMDDIEMLRQVVDHSGKLVAGVSADQWAAPTPCPDWDVRTLVGHLVSGDAWYAAAVRGDHLSPPSVDDPGADFSAVSGDMIAAFSEPDALDRRVALPIGTLPGASAVWMRVVEHLVHGWDIARATGQEPEFGEKATKTALKFSRDLMERADLSHRPFADPKPVADDAPYLDRLVALLGRTP
jgi:uncharacterized protein (TIGR03086 family)